MAKNNLKIIEEPNIIDDHLLDIIGNEFRFDHEKGLAEWLKNSIDAYIRSGYSDSDQNVIFRFLDSSSGDDNAIFECIDFVGMSETDIDKAFKRWGDPEAAKRGSNKRLYGGHGNGGKFYMRQMFTSSHFITYKDGKVNIFGFNKDKKYGFAEGFKSKKVTPLEAFSVAGIEDLIFPDDVKKKIMLGDTGFTVVRGIGPSKMKNLIKFDKLCDKIKNHPQARRILNYANVFFSHNKSSSYVLLKPDEIKPLDKFRDPLIIDIPSKLIVKEETDVEIEMSNRKYKSGRLILKTSEEAFGSGRSADLNRIDIIGEIGVIASYQLFELGVRTFPQASFIYGECECQILEDPDMDAVKNDRSRLVEENMRSKALLPWIRDQIDKYAAAIASEEKKDQEIQGKKISSSFNDFLNKWKDQFMVKVMGDILSSGMGDEGGSDGGSRHKRNLEVPPNGLDFSFIKAEILYNKESKITLKALVPNPIPIGSVIKIKSSSDYFEFNDKIVVKSDNIKESLSGELVAVMNIIVIGKKEGEIGNLYAEIGDHKAQIELLVVSEKSEANGKKPKTPRILLSGYDSDPLNLSGETITLNDRAPLVYQRWQDVEAGIYWINTESPLAKEILNRYGSSSIRWRDYLFQRYVDIFTKQILYQLQKKDPEGFKPERIDSELDVLTRKVHQAAINDLGEFFFQEDFDPKSLAEEE